MSVNHNQSLGRLGEEKASAYLKSIGFTISERNFRTPYGEIDIIAEECGVIVFVEVKTRSTAKYGSGTDAITDKKLQTMIKCAEYYLTVNSINSRARLDVISIDLDKNNPITHLKGVTD